MDANNPIAPVTSDQNAWRLFVFHKHREELAAALLVRELKQELHRVQAGKSPIDALVRAAEIETGLSDCNSPDAALMAPIVDSIAAVCCGARPAQTLGPALSGLEQIDGKISLRCAHPEGFSYYGLHPLDFADLTWSLHGSLRPSLAIIGVRSAGIALSAIVCAVLAAQGKDAQRTSVRPQGEPYHRKTLFTAAQSQWIQSRLEQEADFLVVDEGPGFSGSTFLSVARALQDAGVPASRVLLLGSRPFQNRTETNEDNEWNQYKLHSIAYGRNIPHDAGEYFGNGFWREKLYSQRAQWPACWTEVERSKHLTSDSRHLLKFEGFGRFGERCREQAMLLAAEGFSPAVLSLEQGWACYELVDGRPLDRGHKNPQLLSRLADYCAFRVRNFPAAFSDLEALKNMLENNLELQLGMKASMGEIPLERLVLPDCRMLPHEWLLTAEGKVLKCDVVGHAEGHELPGPVDIAWDLAATIIDWDLSPEETEFFLEKYRRQSSDDPDGRLPAYLLLYSVFRMAFCRMGATSMGAWREARYLLNASRQYEELALRYLHRQQVA